MKQLQQQHQLQKQQLLQQQHHLQQQQLQQQKASVVATKGADEPPQPDVVTQKSPERVKSPAPKIVPGFLAVCPYCGLCSVNHHRCERCRVVFEENVKVIPSAGSDQASAQKAKVIPSLITTDKQKKDQLSVNEIKNSFAGRGRGIAIAVRGRARPKPEEPLILISIKWSLQ